MKRRSNARLFECDGYTFKCWIDPDEARAMCQRGELDLVTDTKGFTIGYRLRETFETSNANQIPPSQSSISLAEMLLNVGLPLRSDDFPTREQIAAAKTKIWYWPILKDERAPLA